VAAAALRPQIRVIRCKGSLHASLHLHLHLHLVTAMLVEPREGLSARKDRRQQQAKR
jgi:hypothetical protein